MSFFRPIALLIILTSFGNCVPPLCSLPAFKGSCRASFSRFFFNPSTNNCEAFLYGGCGGNGNNFESQEVCESVCKGKALGENVQPPLEEINWSNAFCLLAPEVGPCKAYFVRYYYDQKTGNCENFVYGGCGGNGNNFQDSETCLKTCMQQK